MNWCGDTEQLIIGLKSKYQTIDIHQGHIRDVRVPLRNGTPCVSVLPDKLLVTIESLY